LGTFSITVEVFGMTEDSIYFCCLQIELVNQIKVDLVSIREKGMFMSAFCLHNFKSIYILFIPDAELGRLHQKKMKVDFQTSEEEAQNPIDAEIEVLQNCEFLFHAKDL
jgi:hypothetical protein